jgi:Flp pilus assembly protein TadD
MTARRLWCHAWLMAALASGAALADGGGADAASTSPELAAAVEAIRAGQYAAAIRRLEPYTLQFPRDADGWNWLGYAYRKSGQLKPAFARYERALAVDPGHRGAHEYIGEAYLQDGRPEMAERHLKRLEELCRGGCEELDDLRRAIAEYRARTPR